MKGFILCSVLLLTAFAGRSQIVISEEESEEKIRGKRKEERGKKTDSLDVNSTTSVYFVTNWSSTFRTLVLNPEMTQDTLGQRAFEKPLNVWSFGVGIQNQINEHLMWEGGISFYRNGESYTFTGTDTSFSYQNYYSYFGMPLRLNYTIGNDFKFYAGAGLVPQMFSGFKQETQWITTNNSSGSESFKSKLGYNSFVLSAVFNVGFMMDFKNGWFLLVSPEARIQLTSSYQKLNDYIHKGRAYGVTFGLVRNL